MVVAVVSCLYGLVVSVLFIICGADQPYLILNNNGPTILDSNITFTAYLMAYSEKENLHYIFDDGVNNRSIEGGTNASVTLHFPRNLYSEGLYNMTVTVLSQKKIASNYTSFQLGEDLFGHITVLRNGSFANEAEEVGTGENLTFVADIYDPSGYLEDAKIECMWSIDMERYGYTSTHLNYSYSDPGISNIAVLVFASLPTNKMVFGLFTKELSVKVPVNGINVSGNPFLHHDEVLHLNVSCNGTPPFEYCWDIMNPNETVKSNFSCTVIVTNTCFFPINRYFQQDGTYHITIHVSNDVKLVKRNIEVVVYSVSRKPQLSTVIIPIVCSLLTLVIISIGIAYYRQQRKQLIIEVASFDFHNESQIYPERTFFEQFWDSFRCKRCCSSVETDTLFSENEPLLT